MKEFLMRCLHPGMEDGILIEYDKVNMSVELKLCSLRVSSSMCIFGVDDCVRFVIGYSGHWLDIHVE